MAGGVEAEVAAVLAAARCRDVHGAGLCRNCISWGAEVAAALPPLLAERERAARAEALRDAAEAMRDAWPCICGSADWLRVHADACSPAHAPWPASERERP